MKKTKIIIPALGILLLSTAASVTGTVAWFSMNEKVSATNMSIKAKGEAGIAIGAYTGDNQATAPALNAYGDTAVATASTNANAMIPTWTNDAANWYHAKSTSTSSAAASEIEGYKKVTGDNLYLWNKFALKSTGNPQDVYVKAINLTIPADQANYDKCIRVLIKTEDAAIFVFAPAENKEGTETLSAALNTEDDVATDLSVNLVKYASDDAKIFTQLGSTPKYVEIYMYYDGEDVECKSDNIPANFLPTAITVDFSNAK